MATKLTKKQRGELTEKLTGIIQKNNALQLRLSADRTVNELNVNQISGELNRIHGQAIGKELPTVITIPVKQLGSGDPSPDNIRPIVGYEIDGIGTVYGGDLNIETGVLSIGFKYVDLTGLTWSRRTLGTINAVFSATLPYPYIATYLNGPLRQWFCDTYKQGAPSNASTLNATVDSQQPEIHSFSAGTNVETTTIYAIIANPNSPSGALVYETATSDTYTLTPQQMLQLLDQI